MMALGGAEEFAIEDAEQLGRAYDGAKFSSRWIGSIKMRVTPAFRKFEVLRGP